MRNLRILAIFLVIEAALASIVGIMVIDLGIFNVSALWDDPAPVYAIFKAVRTHSIDRRAREVRIPKDIDLHDPGLIRSGFNIYVRSCMICHGGPGLKPSDVVRAGLYPRPPEFSHESHLDLDPRQLFWVIKNGIRMTGMPAWGPSKTDEQLWALVAYVNNLASDDQATSPSLTR